jgi:hypothetical protein
MNCVDGPAVFLVGFRYVCGEPAEFGLYSGVESLLPAHFRRRTGPVCRFAGREDRQVTP